MVYLICNDSVIHISVDSLRMLTRLKESHFWSAAGYGTLAGSAAGALLSVATYHRPSGAFTVDMGPGIAALGGALLGGLAGFTIGGIVGAASGGDETYDLSREPTVEKTKILRDIRRSH